MTKNKYSWDIHSSRQIGCPFALAMRSDLPECMLYRSYGIKFGLALVGVCLADLVTRTARCALTTPFQHRLVDIIQEQNQQPVLCEYTTGEWDL